MDVEPVLLAEPDSSDADSLVSTNIPDEMAGEQTWPTEEEMHAGGDANGDEDDIPDAKDGTTPHRVIKSNGGGKTKKVPKGWSAYQAAWIVDEDDGEVERERSEEGEGEDVEMDASCNNIGNIPQDEDEELEEIEMDSRKGVKFEDLDADEENNQYVHHLSPTSHALTGDLDSPTGALAPARPKTTLRFQTKSILLATSPRARALHGIAD